MSCHSTENRRRVMCMDPRWWYAIGLLLTVAPAFMLSAQKGQQVETNFSPVTLTILYDNNAFRTNLETAWGFSCLVETETHQLLFDTGGDGELLLRNMQKMQVEPKVLNAVIVSHLHHDHLGGLERILYSNADLPIFFPKPFPESINPSIGINPSSSVDVSGPLDILPQIMSLGVLSNGIPEQSVSIQSPQGWIILTGCAHPGVVEIVRHARKILQSDQIYLVLGGFHLTGTSQLQIREIAKNLQNLGVQHVAPCHCSGDNARTIFHNAYENEYIEIGVGSVINVTSKGIEIE